MKEICISPGEAGQRFDKFLEKYLRSAGRSFLYKMLRKKNITLNGKKAEGSEILCAGDSVKLFFSDETFDKFRGQEVRTAAIPKVKLDIVYEDENVIFINKPAGMLSQKGADSDISLCEYIVDYLKQSGQADEESLRAFTPSVCNRLDRNTSGLITAGKSLKGLQDLSEAFRRRTVDKYYLAVVRGTVTSPISYQGYLYKDEAANRVELCDKPELGAERVATEAEPLSTSGGYSLLRVKLLTGKTHQIRATLYKLGYPIVGDKKYGAADLSLAGRQLLHSHELVFPGGRSYRAKPPADFMRVVNGLGLEL